MFQTLVLAVLAIGLFSSPFGVQGEESPVAQTRELVFECYSWGDPHVQTWHPKSAEQIRNRDCYANGEHFLLQNKYVDVKIHVNNKHAIEVNLKFHHGHVQDVCHIKIKANNNTLGDHTCKTHGITWETSTVGQHSTFSIYYPEAQLLINIHENGNCPSSCYYNIYVYQPQHLLDESTGICSETDPGCATRQGGADEVQWEAVRSASRREMITPGQATIICNEYVDAYFARTGRSQHQLDARMNSVVANVLAGCVDDLVLTGEVEMAEGGLDVLMMEELTEHATSVDSVQQAVQSGLERASYVRNDAIKLGRAKARRVL